MPIVNLGPLGSFYLHFFKKENTPLLPVSTDKFTSDPPPPYSATEHTWTWNVLHRVHVPDSNSEYAASKAIHEMAWYSAAAALPHRDRRFEPGRGFRRAQRSAVRRREHQIHHFYTLRRRAYQSSRLLPSSIRGSGPIVAQEKSYEWDMRQLREHIIVPGRDILKHCSESLLYQLIGWYGGPLSYPIPRSDTILSHWEALDSTAFGSKTAQSSRETFQCLISQLSTNEKVARVLQLALDKCI